MTYRPVSSGDHCVLIDGSYLMYRAFHAPRTQGLTNADGEPTGAIFGFVESLWFMLTARSGLPRPATHAVVCFDLPAKTWRHAIAADYKGQRAPRDSTLTQQRAGIRDAVVAFGMRHTAIAGYEADDAIATYCRLARNAGAKVTIMANDKDLMQLVAPSVTMQIKGEVVDEAAVVRKWGVHPVLLGDMLALMNDNVDNIQGVRGIGPDIAAALMRRFGGLGEAVTAAARGEDLGPGVGDKRRAALVEQAQSAFIAQSLIRLDDETPLVVPLDDCAVDEIDCGPILDFCRRMEFVGFGTRVESYRADRENYPSTA